ncbi:twin-arginine translocation signal domain-containing protein [Pelotalea chapellei]|uniref:Twin-arginine translocation signal domain-containing protein n=1 Tax=Pelotalea chapellei TaxID=44671 RepID=A0ABS5U4N9_9BACT|nr:twin-arginine translocation signal domain-containing protein [Pelotalea chapellei]MBT1070617.1 twin-arginine translocation signal domain-containing protein [Pelotalea chapellei]
MDKENMEPCGTNGGTTLTRRKFLKGVGIGGGALLRFGQFGVHSAAWALAGDLALKMVRVDYNKCTGCRTCETVCSSRNRPVMLKGQE